MRDNNLLSSYYCDQTDKFLTPQFRQRVGTRELDDFKTAGHMINPEGAKKREEFRAAQAAAAERKALENANKYVQRQILLDTHLPGVRTEDDHDHAQCIHKLRQAHLKSQMKQH